MWLGWYGYNAAALDTRIKATVAATMYDMSRVNANGYFDNDDNEEARYQNKIALNNQRIIDYQNQNYKELVGLLILYQKMHHIMLKITMITIN